MVMEKLNDELHEGLKQLQEKYRLLEEKYISETTNLTKTVEDLKMRLMFLEGIANSAFDGFLVVNPYGQKILQNQRTIDLWKIPKDIVDDPSGINQVNHVMKMTVNPQQFVSEIDYLREHPNDKTRDELELTDGTILDRYSSPVIGPDGINYGRIWTFHDITDLKNLTKQLIELNENKDHFISILSHDLRSPFNSLLGFADLLRKKVKEYPLEKTEKMIESIYFTARKTYELLEDTLLWANVQTKKITFNPESISINEIIIEVISILVPVANAKNISLQITPNDNISIIADIYMTKAILRNLISNAIKFTNPGGTITVSVTNNSNESVIYVTDNGIGMNSETVEKLFNVNTIHSTKGTANETGTGLGLLLCKEFATRQGGTIKVTSQKDSGTQVCLSLPK
jgi:two-component system, sensor histidine kinase and response regulator